MLILASSSPRRQDLLNSLGLSFEVIIKPVSEDVPPDTEPYRVVELLAERKARAVADERSLGLVIGSDTIVAYQNKILGKPKDEAHAREMLHMLQGSTHDVYSGVAVIDCQTKRTIVTHQRTKVKFKSLSADEINTYIASGEPFGKAGAYAIQGLASVFIEGIEGCYSNVVGLPLERLADVLKRFDYNVLNESSRLG